MRFRIGMMAAMALSLMSCKSSKDQEIEKLRMENERLKLGSGQTTTQNTSDNFLELPPPNMPENEFIEWHRNYQSKNRENSRSYSNYIITKYMSLSEKYKKMDIIGRDYAYLLSRILSISDDQCRASKELLSAYPNFSYAYNAISLARCEDFTFQQRVEYLRKGISLNKNLPGRDNLKMMEKALALEPKAKSIKLDTDLGNTSYQNYHITHLSGNDYRVNIREIQSTNDVTVKLAYKSLIWDDSYGPVYLYTAEIVSSHKIPSIKILKVGIEGGRIWESDDDLKTTKGIIRIPIALDEMERIEKFTIVEIY